MFTDEMRAKEEVKKDKALKIANAEALKWGIIGLGLGTAFTLYNMTYSPTFKKYTVSIKTSIPLMSGIFLWALKYELALVDITRRPEVYGLTDEEIFVEKKPKLPLHQKFMNYVYDHPFVMVAGLGAPLAATVLYKQMHNTHLTFAQKIMHSRVFAQGGIITIALATMAFREWMGRRGRFTEPEE